MQVIKSLTKLLFFLFPVSVFGQTTYLPEGAKEYHILDRLQIKAGQSANLNFSTLKPFSRKLIVADVEFLDSLRYGYLNSNGQDNYKGWTGFKTTPVDDYNIRSLLMNSAEWVGRSHEDFFSKKPVLKHFYVSKPNMYEVNTKDFFLALNPVFQFNLSHESNNSQRLYLNSRGLTARGRIANKIGFSATVVDNQERGPGYFTKMVRDLRAVPGYGFFKSFKRDSTAVDYFDARGYFTFSATKYINFQAGYDKNFIGNGYRSLFLSDWGNSYLFFKINTKIWKLNYQNLFMELMPQYVKDGDSLLDRKYAAMHHLSVNVTKWLNIGLFEGVIFGRKNRFDFQYLNPIIFFRHIEGMIGSPDNAVAGIDFKANVAHTAQVYGQVLFDEFLIKNVRSHPTSWTNKFGFQLGGKYVDAFGIKNLDLQAEVNRVRPFTYSHNNLIGNYTHYNQPLAHPLGANFQEFIGIARYQPAPRWYISGTAIYYYKGLDTATANFGGDIFRNYLDRLGDEGFKVGSGQKVKVFNGILEASYELRENLFIDFSLNQRLYSLAGTPRLTSTMITGGIRLNMAKRKYDY